MQPIIGRLAQSRSKSPFTFMRPASASGIQVFTRAPTSAVTIASAQ